MKSPFFSLLAFFTLFAANSVSATHVVGGEMNYTYLGADSYYVKLLIYVDCYNGSPRAISADSTGVIAVYTGLKFDLKARQELWRSEPIRLEKTNYNCVVPPGDVCVDQYSFDTILTLPNNQLGYYITFQRCCRNRTILNIIDPLNTGSTYFAFIPPKNLRLKNSNPYFNKQPPNYLCQNEKARIDHSATDVDGDSLVYRICTPYNMREVNPPKPILPASPPYKYVNWFSPYSDTLPLDVKKGFSIDPNTGILEFKPTRIGQFVFSTCVDEYRNDEFLSTTFRDYQFNIMPCRFEVKADFELPDFICDSSFTLENKSQKAENYRWKFSGLNLDSSSVQNPTVLLPKPGQYSIWLEASNGNCTDSLSKKLNVIPRNSGLLKEKILCKKDSIQLRGRSFYQRHGAWTSKDTFRQMNDSSILIWPHHNELFIQKSEQENCTFIDSYRVEVPEFEPEIQWDSASHCTGKSIDLLVENDKQFDGIRWMIENGGKQKGKHFELELTHGEKQMVSLYLEKKGCIDSLHFNVSAGYKYDIKFQPVNIITPNNDGFNDCLQLVTEGSSAPCSTYDLNIYNRWGNLIFKSKTKDYAPCWDGRNLKDKQLVTSGVYYYFVEIDEKKFYGSVTVIY